MGQEVANSQFSREDFLAFSARLKDETELLKRWWKEGVLADEPPRVGFELEAWLVDSDARPAPLNSELLETLADPLVCHELAQYNLEFNGTPQALAGQPFSAMEAELTELWQRTGQAAAGLGARLGMIGILPTVGDADLNTERMSRLRRYQALNEQVLALRNQRPLTLNIDGIEQLRVTHADVMLESAATSLQLHLQASPAQAPRLYNASVVASAASVAVAANSPFLFGRRLWEETRIPVFEQAVAVRPQRGAHAGPLARVSFGTGYARDALYGFFVENRQHYPVLLPVLLDEPPERLAHLSLHNGTIWRWNRPLVGFNADGKPHLRIEHRVMAAGPTVVDIVANAAFYQGVVQGLAAQPTGAEARLPFPVAEHNFYEAARYGLAAEVVWSGGARVVLAELIERELLPLAARGLEHAGVERGEIDRYLQVIEARVRTRRTGAAWQADYVQRHGADFAAMLTAYLERQDSNTPVHSWSI